MYVYLYMNIQHFFICYGYDRIPKKPLKGEEFILADDIEGFHPLWQGRHGGAT